MQHTKKQYLGYARNRQKRIDELRADLAAIRGLRHHRYIDTDRLISEIEQEEADRDKYLKRAETAPESIVMEQHDFVTYTEDGYDIDPKKIKKADASNIISWIFKCWTKSAITPLGVEPSKYQHYGAMLDLFNAKKITKKKIYEIAESFHFNRDVVAMRLSYLQSL
jgi:hypothetical protein